MDHVQPLPADRLTPQPRREKPAQRDGKKHERAFDVPGEAAGANDVLPSARPHVEAHEDGTGSRLDVTA